MRAEIPINLTPLPIDSTNPDAYGSEYTVRLVVDDFGRWGAELLDEDEEVADELFPYHSAQDALNGVSLNYPGARFTPPDEESNE